MSLSEYNMYVRMSHFSMFTMCVLDTVFLIVRPKFVVLKVVLKSGSLMSNLINSIMRPQNKHIPNISPPDN